MLNAANLGWVAAHSPRKEKVAEEEAGAGARPRGGSAAAGFAGRAVVDPALPDGGHHPLPPGASPGRGLPGEAGKEGPWTTGSRLPAPTWRLSARRSPAAARSSPGKVVPRRVAGCAGAGRSVRGPGRSAAPRGRCRRPPAAGLCAVRAAPHPSKAELPTGKSFGLGTRLNCARLSGGVRARLLRSCPGAGPPRAPPSLGGPAGPRPCAGASAAEGPGPAHSCARPGRREAVTGAARVASRTLNL